MYKIKDFFRHLPKRGYIKRRGKHLSSTIKYISALITLGVFFFQSRITLYFPQRNGQKLAMPYPEIFIGGIRRIFDVHNAFLTEKFQGIVETSPTEEVVFAHTFKTKFECSFEIKSLT